MSPEPKPISSKAVIMLDDAIQELCDKNRCEGSKVFETYDIEYTGDDMGLSCPTFRESLHDLNYSPVDATRSPIFRVVEALWTELTGPTPALFKRRWVTVASPESGERKEFLRESRRFFRQLNSEGYEIRGGLVQAIDPEAPAEYVDKTALAIALRAHVELDPAVLISHIEESDDNAARGNWHSAAGEARSFIEGLVVGLAKTESTRTNTAIRNLPNPGDRRSSFGPAREFLHSGVNFISGHENDTIKALYSLASVKGAHPGLTDEQSAVFVRRVCWIIGGYLLNKYAAWKRNGYKW